MCLGSSIVALKILLVTLLGSPVYLSVFVCQISDLSKRCSSVRVKVCPDGQLQCGNGECIGVEFFCDKKPDCSDGRFLQSFLSAFKSCRFISCSQRWKRLFCYGGPQSRWCKWFHWSFIWNNRFQVCDLAECLLPDCFCSADGTQAPGIEGGKLEVGRKS